MNSHYPSAHPASHNKEQNGLALVVVMVILLLASLVLLGSSRVTVINEFFIRNQSHSQRAAQAAQLLINDAHLDIMSQTAAGANCVRGTANCRPAFLATGFSNNNVISLPATQSKEGDLEPDPAQQYDRIRGILATRSPPCMQGVCLSLDQATPGFTQFWNNDAQWGQMQQVGAQYGQFTGGANINTNSNALTNRLVLAGGPGRYWIEVLPCNSNPLAFAIADNALTPVAGKSCSDFGGFLYRITAVVPSGQGGFAVLQSVVFH